MRASKKPFVSILCFAIAAVTLFPNLAAATDYPQHDIVAICQFGAGGGNDIQMRAIAPYLKKYLPNPVNVVVENRTGGGGIVATNYVWTARPDGYTLLQAQVSAMLVQEITNPEIPFKNSEFRWIGVYSLDSLVVVVRPDFPAQNWDELVKYSQENTLKIGTAGAGSNTHIQAELFRAATGLKANMVHYSDGTAGVIGGFGRGEIDMFVFSIGTQSLGAVKNGSVHNFCVIAGKPNEFLTDVPTLEQIGMPKNLVDAVLAIPLIGAPRGLAVPPNTPDEIVAVLDEAMQKALADPELVAWAEKSMLNWTPMNAQDTQKWVAENIEHLTGFSDMLKEIVN